MKAPIHKKSRFYGQGWHKAGGASPFGVDRAEPALRSWLAFLQAPVPCSKQKLEGYIAKVLQIFLYISFA